MSDTVIPIYAKIAVLVVVSLGCWNHRILRDLLSTCRENIEDSIERKAYQLAERLSERRTRRKKLVASLAQAQAAQHEENSGMSDEQMNCLESGHGMGISSSNFSVLELDELNSTQSDIEDNMLWQSTARIETESNYSVSTCSLCDGGEVLTIGSKDVPQLESSGSATDTTSYSCPTWSSPRTFGNSDRDQYSINSTSPYTPVYLTQDRSFFTSDRDSDSETDTGSTDSFQQNSPITSTNNEHAEATFIN